MIIVIVSVFFEKIIMNNDFFKMMDILDEWILLRMGICEWRCVIN